MFVKIMLGSEHPDKAFHAGVSDKVKIDEPFKIIECVNAEIRKCPYNKEGEDFLSVACSLSVDNGEVINYRFTGPVYFLNDAGKTVARYGS